MRDEIIPIVATAADASSFVPNLPPVDVIITCDEDLSNYVAFQQARLSMIKQICKHSKAQKPNVKPLVIYSSGCKDYGMTPMHGEEGLAPQTEMSPLNPPDFLRPRTDAATDMLTNHTEDFDCVVTRPTTLYGRSGSHYSHFFILAERAKQQTHGVLELPASPNAVLHGTHIDGIAAAYLALATAPRQRIAGQSYNMSSHRYETLAEIVPAIEKSHGVTIKFRNPKPDDVSTFGLYALALFMYPQWVGSEKFRADLGWSDVKPLFHEGYELYRKAYEAAEAHDPEQVERVKSRKAAVAVTLEDGRIKI